MVLLHEILKFSSPGFFSCFSDMMDPFGMFGGGRRQRRPPQQQQMIGGPGFPGFAPMMPFGFPDFGGMMTQMEQVMVCLFISWLPKREK